MFHTAAQLKAKIRSMPGCYLNMLYYKNELTFSLFWIVIYVWGTSITNILSLSVGLNNLITMIYHIVLSLAIFLWIQKMGLMIKYGLCKTSLRLSSMLYYLPLVAISSCNLWFGVSLNLSLEETVCGVISMLCVGFLEEIIFRGFLFKVLAKNNLRLAVIISSVTFGVGHIINLFNGSGTELLSNVCQIIYAAAFGLMTVVIFIKSESLLPCIAAHSIVNVLSVFVVESNISTAAEIIGAVALTVITVGYTLYLLNANLQKKQ